MPQSTPNTAQMAAASVVRHTMTAGGITGILQAQDEILKLVSLLITVLGLAWSIWEKVSTRKSSGGGTAAASLFFALCLLPSAFCLSGCVLVKSPEQTMLTAAQTSHTTAQNALARWNDWLGFQRNQMLLMSPEDAQSRLAELQAIERRVMAAVDEINRAKQAAAAATDLYYDSLSAVARTNAPAADVIAARRLVEDANAIMTAAERALLQILTLYIPELRS